jgi:hypothetical protein
VEKNKQKNRHNIFMVVKIKYQNKEYYRYSIVEDFGKILEGYQYSNGMRDTTLNCIRLIYSDANRRYICGDKRVDHDAVSMFKLSLLLLFFFPRAHFECPAIFIGYTITQSFP